MLVIDLEADASGTHKIGEVSFSYNELVAKLGQPIIFTSEDDDKVTAEWVLVSPKNRVMTVHDWKEDRRPSSRPDHRITWSIGGRSTGDYLSVLQFLGVI